MYMNALYTVSSVSSVVASPGNSLEQMTAVLLMLIGSTLWAQVTGIFAAVLSTMNPHSIAFRISLDNLNSFMRTANFDSDFQYRVCSRLLTPSSSPPSTWTACVCPPRRSPYARHPLAAPRILP